MGLELMRPELTELKPRITVIGVGGAGGNAVTNMINSGLMGVDFIVGNTDAQALAYSPAETRIQLGLKITQGLGAGSRPEIGRAAAEETLDILDAALDGSHMCFITAGMGGGTGTGAAPVIARSAREKGILTVGVVTKPFHFEGAKRMRAAEEGIAELQKHVDTLIIIPNQNLFLIANANTTFKEAFAMADQVLHQGVRGITDLMIMPGLINLDFADIRTVMSEMGKAMMGTGEASGDNRAIEAAEKAIANPLLDEVSMRGAKGVIINITGGDDLRLMEVDEAANHIREMVDPDANIIVGSAFNPEMDGKMRVSVVATGIDAQPAIAAAPVVRPRAAGFGAVAGSLSSVQAAAARPAAPEQVAEAAPAVEAPAEPQAPAIRLDPPEPLADSVAAQPAAAAQAEALPERVVDYGNVHALRTPEAVEQPVMFTDYEPPAPIVSGPRDFPAPEPRAMRPQAPVEPKLTLFERMINLSRGSAQIDERAGEAADPQPHPSADPNAIPGFLRRQSNS